MRSDNTTQSCWMLASEAETTALAARLAPLLQPGMVIFLEGDLGAGKTTLVRAILQALGYHGRVKSPTYTLLEPYHINGIDFCHFDLYRMYDADEWEASGFREEIHDNSICFIEWPEKASGQLPPPDLTLHWDILPQGRQLTLISHNQTGQQCLLSESYS